MTRNHAYEIIRVGVGISIKRIKHSRSKPGGKKKANRRTKNNDFLTIVILFFLLGVSAKHFNEDESCTVSQKVTTGSATCDNNMFQNARTSPQIPKITTRACSVHTLTSTSE